MQKAHVFIEGRVQGVGFRHFTKVNAKEIGVYGWVKNLPDGRVEAVFIGPMDHLREIVNRCEQGPGSSRVDDVDVTVEDAEKEFDHFEIRHF